jgi:hypothetical protein
MNDTIVTVASVQYNQSAEPEPGPPASAGFALVGVVEGGVDDSPGHFHCAQGKLREAESWVDVTAFCGPRKPHHLTGLCAEPAGERRLSGRSRERAAAVSLPPPPTPTFGPSLKNPAAAAEAGKLKQRAPQLALAAPSRWS